MESLWIVIAFLAGAVAGYVLTLKMKTGENVSRSKYDALTQEKTALATRLEAAANDCEKLKEEREQGKRERTEFHERAIKAEKQLALIQQALEAKQKEMEDWDKLKDTMVKAATASVMENGNKLSNKLLEDHKREAEAAKKDGEEQVRKTTAAMFEQVNTLVAQVGNIKEQQNINSKQFNNVMRMLSTPHGAGNLAEIGLENTLKALNLIDGRDFRLQYTISAGESQGLRPDCLVFLPQNIVMVIDSKSSKLLGEFTDIDSAEKEKEIIEKLASSMNNHLKRLASKNYNDAIKKEYASAGRNGDISIVWNVMYIPSESILEKILSVDPSFRQKCSEEQIIPVGPVGLNGLLMMAARQVELAKQSEHYHQILETMGTIVEKFATSLGHLALFSKQFGTAANTFEKVIKSLNRTLIPKLSQLSGYGITSAKSKETLLKLPSFEVRSSDETLVIEDASNDELVKLSIAAEA